MTKTILIGGLLLCMAQLQAQEFQNKDLQKIVDTERDFARMAKEQNRKDAFLFYLSDDVITSGPNGINVGKEQIEKQEVTEDWLFWDVAFCDIAASGDLGYDTGPWEYRAKQTDEKPIAFGEFNSIWKKQDDGSWKNVLDIGTRHGQATVKVVAATTAKPLVKGPGNIHPDDEATLQEKKFLELYRTSTEDAYKKYLSTEARVVHMHHLPVVNSDEILSFISEAKLPADPELKGGETASSHDLGYVYGTGKVMVTSNDQEKEVIATYVRVWKKEDGRNWRIVLDVLTY